MKYFISAGEPSGELHGANLMKRLRVLDPAAEFCGFGGDRMQQEGCKLLYPLSNHPCIGLVEVFARFGEFLKLLRQTEQFFEQQRPDAVVLIDYPGFNWQVAKRAKRHGIPVFYFVPPQIWAWATYRVHRMRRLADQVLCSLPFEEAWYRQRNVPGATYVGHPYFDALFERRYDEAFIEKQKSQGQRIVAVLPGSRTKEVQRNFADMVRAMEIIHRQAPDVRFLVAGFKEKFRPMFERQLAGCLAPVQIHFDKTPEIMKLATTAIAVSGSVSMELMHHHVPTVIVYRMPWSWKYVLRPMLLRSPFITLVNLIAGQRVYPELVDDHDLSAEAAAQTLRWLNDESARLATVAKLTKLDALYGQPGACSAAAHAILDALRTPRNLRKAG